MLPHDQQAVYPETPPLFADPLQLEIAIAYLQRGQEFEIRAICESNGQSFVLSGRFSNASCAAPAIASIDQNYRPSRTGLTLNAIRPSQTASYGCMRRPCGPLTRAEDVRRLRYLTVDVDPIVPPEFRGMPASDMEQKAAVSAAYGLSLNLSALYGLPSPIAISTGNGALLLYPVDLDINAVDSRIGIRFAMGAGQILDGLGFAARVDARCSGPAMMPRIPGTVSRRGTECPSLGRVYRRVQWLGWPSNSDALSLDQIESVCRHAQSKAEPTRQPMRTVANATVPGGLIHVHGRLDVEAWLDDVGITFSVRDTSVVTKLFTLSLCPACDAPQKAWIQLEQCGRLSAGCFRDSCELKSWADLKQWVAENLGEDQLPSRQHYRMYAVSR